MQVPEFHILATDHGMLAARWKPMRTQMTLDDRVTRLTPHVRSVVRITVGLLFLEHGLSKLFGFPAGTVRELFTLSWYSGAIEFATGALLTLGLATRAAAFIASGEMAFAYFLGHAPKAFFPLINGGEGAILYCFIFLYLAFAGGGPWSLDATLKGRRLPESGGRLPARTRRA